MAPATRAPLDTSGHPLSIVSVHAHPDDEASKGSATIARYHDEGVHTVLVCCTGGEAGDILNPAVDTPEVRGDLAAVRRRELDASAAVIGYDVVDMLGYHDSGMPDSEVNARPDNFANAPLEEAVGRLVRILRAERPQVIVTYADDREFYPHPDHIRVHEISMPAFDAAGDADLYPDAGEPWQPSKLYYTGFSARRVKAMHEAFLRRGEESPYAQWFERGFPEHDTRFTTFVDVGDWLHRRRGAAGASHAGRSRWALDAFARRRGPRRVPVGRVRAGALVGRAHRRGRGRGRPVRRRARRGIRGSGGLSHRYAPTVPKYLTQPWLDESRELAKDQPDRPGASATIQYVVSGGPDGDVKYYWVLENGKLLEAQIGEIASAQITLTLPYDVSVEVQQGELDANVAFMQGRMKAAGDMGKLMQLLPLTTSPEYKALQEKIRAITQY